jgi:hypothetical protein
VNINWKSLCWIPVLVAAAPCAASSPWASGIVSYTPGTGIDPAYANPGAALGEPTRFTGVGIFPGAVTPFNPAWMAGELVSIGPGGSLTVEFPRPVHNDPLNPFGVDFIIFGNAGYMDTSFPSGVAGGLFGAGGGIIEVSANGTQWHTVQGAIADGAFPTLGFLDLADPYATSPGSILSDFTRPVDPSFAATGLNFAQIVSGYAGSGGGSGVDIAATGLSWIQYVRITNPMSASGNVDIDAFAIVTPIPTPGAGALALLLLGGAGMSRPRRRGGC